MSNALEFALRYAKASWPVFPCKPGAKVPATPNGFKDATTDTGIIDAWWSEHPDCNIGIATGPQAGIWALDVDAADGLVSLQAEHGKLPQTLSQTTGSGGRHLLFRWEDAQPVGNRAKFWPGLDVRGEGGYIVAPPSVTEKGAYSWDNRSMPASAPSWLYRLLDRPRTTPTPLPSDGYDGLGDAWGRALLEDEILALASTPEGARHDTLKIAALKVFGAVKGRHLSAIYAEGTLRTAAQTCGLDAPETEALLSWGKAHAEERHPLDKPAAPKPLQVITDDRPPPPDAPSDEEPTPEPQERRRRWPIYSTDQLAAIRPPEWIVADHIPDGLCVLYGPSGSHKSFTALDWAMSVATGHTWLGNKVRSSPVVYVMAEGASGGNQRIDAWKADRTRKPDGLHVIPAAPNLLNPSHVEDLALDVDEQLAGLLVIDTMARCMVGGDENSAQDVGRFVAALDTIRARTNCGVLVVHHSGHDSTRPRGSTALFAAADAVVRCEVNKEGLIELSCHKQKDAGPFLPWRLQAKPVCTSLVLTTTKSRGTVVDPVAAVRQLLLTHQQLSLTDLRTAGISDSQIVQLESSAVIERDGTAYVRAGEGAPL